MLTKDYIIKDSSMIARYGANILRGNIPLYPRGGLKAHWTFDNTLEDSSGHGNHFSMTRGSANYGTGKIGDAAFEFYINPTAWIELTASSSSLTDTFMYQAPWTVAWWEYVPYVVDGSYVNFQAFICEGWTGFTDGGGAKWNTIRDYRPAHYHRSETYGTRFKDTTNAWLNVDPSSFLPPNVSSWNHIVMSYDGLKIKGYYNNGNDTLVLDEVSHVLYITQSMNNNFRIHQDYFTTVYGAKIDSMYVYNKELSADERNMLWNDGKGI